MDSRKYLIVLAILVTELCERLTYYSITGNLVLYFQVYLKIPTQISVAINLAFTGVVYFVPFFGGWLADSVSGRFNSIYGAFLIYLLGALLLPVVAFDYVTHFGPQYQMSIDEKRVFFFIGLGLIAIGTGGIKANVSPFGAQQLEREGQGTIQIFFNWFYWFINVGSAIAFSLVVYVQQNINFFYGYLIPTVTIAVGLITFIIPRNAYECEQPKGSALTDLFRIVIEGLRSRKRSIYKFRSFLDYARIRNGGNFPDESVDGLITIVRMLPIFGTLVLFWTIYFQGQSTYLVQSERMNIKLGSLSLPFASLNLFNTIIILIATPIVDRIILPLIQRLRNGVKLSMLTRMGFGLVVAACSTFVAGGVEIARKNDIAANGPIYQKIEGSDTGFNASSMSVLYQIPQFMLIGFGEIFTSITGLEFAFSEAPIRLRGVVMGLCLCTSGLGSFFGSALVAIVAISTKSDNWMPDEINDGHFEYYCFLLGGLMILNAIIYVPIAKWYKRKKEKAINEATKAFDYQNNYGSMDDGVSTNL